MPLLRKTYLKREYQTYLKSAHWKKIQKIVYSQKSRCYVGNERYPLNIHHTNYENLYNESLQDLVVLCEFHHKALHSWAKMRGWKPDWRTVEPTLSRCAK
jgi:hypothetical protein